MRPMTPPAFTGTLPVRRIATVGFTVADLDRAVGFFTRVLAFAKVFDVTVAGATYARLTGVARARLRVARLQLGDAIIELTQYLASIEGKPMPIDSRGNDRWFQHLSIIVRDMDAAYAHLERHGVRHVSPRPQRLPDSIKGAEGIRSFYFRDPDGHFLELLQYPPDKGDAQWHALPDPANPLGRLFLGVDHTAIVVRDTDVSLRFYRDTLGMTVRGQTFNEGIEQSLLTGVPGARIRITSLRFPTGMGVELLDYREPPDGRPAPAEMRANDLAHAEIRLVMPDVGRALRYVRDHALPVVSDVSDDGEALPVHELGFSRAVLVRDPDGHGIELASF